jgi:hypothetical protein
LGTLLQAYEKLNVLEAAKGNTVKITVIAPSVIADQKQHDLLYAVEEVKKITSAVGDRIWHGLAKPARVTGTG